MSDIYDRQGNPITDAEYMALWKRPDIDSYRRVAEDTVGRFWVSTVWLGLDHAFVPDGPRAIFETMVFLRSSDDFESGSDLDHLTRRYASEAEALAGHREVVLEVTLEHYG